MTTGAQRRLLRIVVSFALVASVAWLIVSQNRARSVADKTPSSVGATPTPTPASTNNAATNGFGATTTANPVAFDFRAALEATRRLRNPRERTAEFSRLLQLWVEQDPTAALLYVRTLPRGTEFTQALFLVVDHLAATDLDQALALAHELATSRQDQVIYASLFARMAEKDVVTAARRLAGIPAGEARNHALRAVGSTWAQKDFPAALAWGQGISSPAERSLAIAAVISTLVPTEPLRAIQLGQQWLTGNVRDQILEPALRQLTATQVSDAATIVAALPAGLLQTRAAPEVARQLAAENPQTAIDWIKSLPDSAAQCVALNNVLDVWGVSDPAAAGRYVVEMPAGLAKTAAAVYLARVLGHAAPATAVTWVQALGDPALIDPAQTALASSWAQRDGAAASRWAATLPVGSAQMEALNGALSYWVLQDIRGAREFVQTLDSSRQPAAAATLAPSLAQKDPAAAMAWAESLPTASARDAASGAAYRRWLDNAPDVARAWLNEVGLSAETKAKLERAGK